MDSKTETRPPAITTRMATALMVVSMVMNSKTMEKNKIMERKVARNTDQKANTAMKVKKVMDRNRSPAWNEDNLKSGKTHFET